MTESNVKAGNTTPAPQSQQPPGVAAGRHALVWAGVLAAMFLAAMETLITGTIMPAILSETGGFTLYAWVTTSFMIAATVTTPIYGKLSDVVGIRRVMLFAIGVFLVGSLLCGLANSMPMLIACRALQGVGGGGLLSLAFVFVGILYPPQERGRRVGQLSLMWGVASVGGPAIGAACVALLSWRWAFLVNVPLSALAFAGVATFKAAEPSGKRARVDYAGATVFTLGSVAALYAIMKIGEGFSAPVLASAVIGVVLLVVFAKMEARIAEPLFPFKLFKNRDFSVPVGFIAVSGAAIFVLLTLIPLHVQGVLGRTAGDVGKAVGAIVLGWVVGSNAGGRLVNVIGIRSSSIIGAVLIAVGMIALVPAAGSTSLAVLIPVLAINGVGMGFSMTTTIVTVQSAVPRVLVGVATSGVTLMRTIGAMIGISIFAGVQLAVFKRGLAEQFPSPPPVIRDLIAKPEILLDPLRRATIGHDALQSVSGSLYASLRFAFALSVIVALVNLVLAAMMPKDQPAALAARSAAPPRV